MKRLLAIAASAVLILTGCASEPEFGEVSSAIQDSQDMQAEESQSPEPEPEPRKSSSLDPEVLERAQAAEQERLKSEGNLDFARAKRNGLWKVTTDGAAAADLAFEEVRRYLTSAQVEKGNSVVAANTVDSSVVSKFQDAISLSKGNWANLIGINDEFRVVIFTRDDASWADEQTKIFGGTPPYGSWVKLVANEPGPSCTVDAKPGVIYACIWDDLISSSDGVLELVAHEYFHEVQNRLSVSHLDWPLWLMEGSATFFAQVAIQESGADMLGTTGRIMGDVIARKYGYPWVGAVSAEITQAQAVEIFEKLEVAPTASSRQTLQDYKAYEFGSLAFLRLVEEKGIDDVIEFVVRSANEPWKQLFESQFGYSTGQFYDSMADYLHGKYVWDY